MSKESPKWREWEQKAEEYLHLHYPPNRKWVKENLETLQEFRSRSDFKSDSAIVSWAIKTTEDFAKQSGINNPDRRMESGILHVPSRLAAIRRFESSVSPLMKQLTLDKIVQIYIIAETTNIQRSIHFASSDKTIKDLQNLTNLIGLHKEITGL